MVDVPHVCIHIDHHQMEHNRGHAAEKPLHTLRCVIWLLEQTKCAGNYVRLQFQRA